MNPCGGMTASGASVVWLVSAAASPGRAVAALHLSGPGAHRRDDGTPVCQSVLSQQRPARLNVV